MKIFFKIISYLKWKTYKKAKRYILKYNNFSYKFEENGEKLLLDKLSSENFKNIFDVGAHTGSWSKIAYKCFPNAKIHAFEISKTNFKSLKKNLKSERFKINNLGLSNKKSEIYYKDHGANSEINSIINTMNFHEKNSKYSYKKACLISGDSYCFRNKINKIDLLKIDVEGAEYLVISGFKKMLKEKKIKVIQFEYGYATGDTHFLVKDFYSLLQKNGYIVGPLKSSGVFFSDFRYIFNDFNSGPNYVAVQKKETKIIKLLKTHLKNEYLD